MFPVPSLTLIDIVSPPGASRGEIESGPRCVGEKGPVEGILGLPIRWNVVLASGLCTRVIVIEDASSR